MLKTSGRRVDLSSPFAYPSQHVQGDGERSGRFWRIRTGLNGLASSPKRSSIGVNVLLTVEPIRRTKGAVPRAAVTALGPAMVHFRRLRAVSFLPLSMSRRPRRRAALVGAVAALAGGLVTFA